MVSKETLNQSINRRQRKSVFLVILMSVLSVIVLIPLVSIIEMVIQNGIKAFTPHMIYQYATTLAPERNALIGGFIGSTIMIALGVGVALPISIVVGVLCVEYPTHWITKLSRLSVDIIQGTPSIVVGIVVYCWMVMPNSQFSGLAGGVALAIIMLPVTIRSTEEVLLKVPSQIKESALALGVPYFRAIQKAVLPSAMRGIVSSACIAISRVSGETAPLLLTALGTPFITTNILKEMGALPLMIYHYATSPDTTWQYLAWGGAMALISMNVILVTTANWIGYEK